MHPPRQAGGESDRPLNVLFLGDRGHHRPADRAAQITPVFAGRGIDVTYTEKLGDLNPETLARYDALLDLRQHQRDHPGQEKALLDYVEGGGGFVPLHCASYCFLNSPKYIALVGAQFQRHGTGDVRHEDRRPVASDHEGLRAVPHLGRDLRAHQAQREGPPRAAGPRRGTSRGAVDVGADAGQGTRLLHGLRPRRADLAEPRLPRPDRAGHSLGRRQGEVFDSRARVAAGLPPFTYEETPAEIPNYLPGRQWGTQGEPIRKMQKPLVAGRVDPAPGRPAGFEPRLFAAEPEIYKPLCMAWDHRGRLWIAESADYPNTKQPDGQGRDRITICEDTDGDGRADKFTVFAEGLNIPTSLLCADGGVIVLQAPDTLFLKDTDGDGKADVRKVLFTGWGTATRTPGRATCAGGSTTGSRGSSATRRSAAPSAARRIRFGQGFYRFKPDGSKLEFLRSTNNNSWGVGFSEEGLVFGSTANGCPSVYMPIPNRYYEAVRGWSPRVLESIAASNSLLSRSPSKVRQVDWHGGFTAAAGHALYTARTYPRALLEPDRLRGRADRATWSPRSRSSARGATSPTTTAGTCWPATTNGPRRSRPRSAPTATSG